MNVFIYTLGCKVNEVDSEIYAQELRELGAVVVSDLSAADAVVVNSCSVTNRAQAQSMQFVRHAQRQRPDAHIFLAGCGSSLLELTRSRAPAGVTVIGMGDRAKLAAIIAASSAPIVDAAPWIQRTIQRAGPRNRVDVRIQEGCDNLCTYCVIPYVRGAHLQSKPVAVAVDEVVHLAKTGVKEIVLTGTEIGKYGDAPGSLALLLDAMLGALEAEGLHTRVRISSLNPDAITEELVDQFARHPALCPQLHLPLQSGSDAILRRMRRPYAAADLLSSVQRLRLVNPLFTFTTDVIVGFPGETEEDFQATLDVIQAAGFAKVHAFRFSARPFTPAAREPNQIPASIARQRLHRVLDLSRQTGLAVARQFIGQEVTIVSEQVSEGIVKGYSEHYLWTEGSTGANVTLERDSFIAVRVDGLRFDGERVVLEGCVLEHSSAGLGRS